MSTRIARFAIFALGLIAVSALLFQPICEAAERHLAHGVSHATAAGGDEVDSCCSMVASAALRTAASLANASSPPVAAPIVGSPVLRPHIVIYDALRAAAPPPVLGYYIRSARIQR
jgi:hypothetical protein